MPPGKGRKRDAAQSAQVDALMQAAEKGDWQAIAVLLSEPDFNINARDRGGYTALHYTANHGRDLATQLLLDNAADVNSVNSQTNKTPLHCACNGSHGAVVEMLLSSPEAIATVNEKTAKSGATALHCVAVSSGKAAHSIARALIAAGASVNARDNTGTTALAYAIRQGRRYELVETLLAHNADPNLADAHNVAPIHHAAASANPAFVLLLQAHGANVSCVAQRKAPLPPLHIAARRGNIETCRVLIQLGSDPNELAKSKKRPLHFAAHGGHVAVVTFLLESGASVDHTDGGSLTALMYGAIVGSTEVTTNLLALGAKANQRTAPDNTNGMPKGLAALHFAVMNGHPGVAAVLCAYDTIEVDALDGEKRSPLHWAAYHGSADSISTLLAYSADPQRKDSVGRIPLHVARDRGNDAAVAALSGANGGVMDSSSLPRVSQGLSMYCRHCHFRKGRSCPQCAPKSQKSQRVARKGAVITEKLRIDPSATIASQYSMMVQKIGELKAKKGKGFADGFNALVPVGMHLPKRVSMANAPLNRYNDIFSFDYNRVRLSKRFHKKDNGYINASFIYGLSDEPRYIAAQGPKDTTVHSFWQMAWENGTKIIVMLTRVQEGDRVKCLQYWPEGPPGSTEIYGDFEVKTVKEVDHESYILRTLRLKPKHLKADGRVVLQYIFTAWPDNGVPRTSAQLLHMYWNVKRRILNCRANSTTHGLPIIHCSAGVGRTGTFILLDYFVQAIRARVRIDVDLFIRRLRMCRNYMVQSLPQYAFAYRLAIDVLKETMQGSERVSMACRLRAFNEGDTGAPPPRSEGKSRRGSSSSNRSSRRGSTGAPTRKSRVSNPFMGERMEGGGLQYNPQIGRNAEDMAEVPPDQAYTVKYFGSQGGLVTDKATARATLNRILERQRKTRPVSLHVSRKGAEIVEKGKSAGLLCRSPMITFVAVIRLSADAQYFCLCTNGTEPICHVFGASSTALSSLEQHIAVVVALSDELIAESNSTEDAAYEKQLAEAMSRSISDKQPKHRAEPNSLTEEEQLALALQASVRDTSGARSGAGIHASAKESRAEELTIPGLSEDEQLEMALRESAEQQRQTFDQSNPFAVRETRAATSHSSGSTDRSIDMDGSGGAVGAWHAALGRGSLAGTPSSDSRGTPTAIATHKWEAAGALAAAAETLNVIRSSSEHDTEDAQAEAEYAALMASINQKVESDTGVSLTKLRHQPNSNVNPPAHFESNDGAPAGSNPFVNPFVVLEGSTQGVKDTIDDDDDLLYGGADSWDATSQHDEFENEDDAEFGESPESGSVSHEGGESYFATEPEKDDVELENLYVDSDPEDLDPGTAGVPFVAASVESASAPIVSAVTEPASRPRADTVTSYVYEGSDDEDFDPTASSQPFRATSSPMGVSAGFGAQGTPLSPLRQEELGASQPAVGPNDDDLEGDIADWLQAHSDGHLIADEVDVDAYGEATSPVEPALLANPFVSQKAIPAYSPSDHFGEGSGPSPFNNPAEGEPQYEDEDDY